MDGHLTSGCKSYLPGGKALRYLRGQADYKTLDPRCTRIPPYPLLTQHSTHTTTQQPANTMHFSLPSLLLISAMATLPAAALEPSPDPPSSDEPCSFSQPEVIAGAALVGVGVAAVVAPAVIVGPALNLAGFGPLGPVAGSSPPSPFLQRYLLSPKNKILMAEHQNRESRSESPSCRGKLD